MNGQSNLMTSYVIRNQQNECPESNNLDPNENNRHFQNYFQQQQINSILKIDPQILA